MFSKLKVASSIRLFLGILAVLVWGGLYLTGFNSIHWLLYVPAAILTVASVTGICPGIFLSKMVTKG